MEVFNTKRLTQKQRFNSAIVIGAIASIVIGIATGFVRIAIARATGFELSIINMGAAYALAMVIQKVGRGVQQKFSILGGILGFVTISIANVVAIGYPIIYIFNLGLHLQIWAMYLAGGVNTLITLIYQGLSVYIAYYNSRII